MLQQPALTADEQKLNDVWNEHVRAEFDAHSADETVATMVGEPLINEVPVMIGGDGKEEVYDFYAKYCLPQIPHIRPAGPYVQVVRRDMPKLSQTLESMVRSLQSTHFILDKLFVWHAAGFSLQKRRDGLGCTKKII